MSKCVADSDSFGMDDGARSAPTDQAVEVSGLRSLSGPNNSSASDCPLGDFGSATKSTAPSPTRRPVCGGRAKNLLAVLLSVSARWRRPPYANAVVLLYLLTAVLGAIVYPEFRVTIRNVVEELGHHAVMGTFELKEHFVMVGVAVLPAYWLFWRPPLGLLLSTCWRCGTTTRCSRTTRRSAKLTGAYKNRATVRRCTGMAGCQPLLWPRWALPR